METKLFTMERCSDFESPRKGAADRRTFAFVNVTEEEAYAAGLESSDCVYDRGLNAGDDWILRVPLDDIEGAPLCVCCDIASVTLDACDMCELCARAAAHGSRREPRERSYGGDEGPRDHIAYFARLGRAGY